jgi:hypothetical protein
VLRLLLLFLPPALQVLPPSRLPPVYVQVCLPEGRIRLSQVLKSLQDSSDAHVKARREEVATFASTYKAAVVAAEAAAAASRGGSFKGAAAAPPAAAATSPPPPQQQQQQRQAAAAAAEADVEAGFKDTLIEDTRDDQSPASVLSAIGEEWPAFGGSSKPAWERLFSNTPGARRAAAAADNITSRSPSPNVSNGGHGRGHSCFGGCAGACCCAAPSGGAPRVVPTGCSFWRDFSARIHVLCLSEMKYAMMAHNIVGVPGGMTLLCNLSTTVDFGLDALGAKEVRVCAQLVGRVELAGSSFGEGGACALPCQKLESWHTQLDPASLTCCSTVPHRACMSCPRGCVTTWLVQARRCTRWVSQHTAACSTHLLATPQSAALPMHR